MRAPPKKTVPGRQCAGSPGYLWQWWVRSPLHRPALIRTWINLRTCFSTRRPPEILRRGMYQTFIDTAFMERSNVSPFLFNNRLFCIIIFIWFSFSSTLPGPIGSIRAIPRPIPAFALTHKPNPSIHALNPFDIPDPMLAGDAYGSGLQVGSHSFLSCQ